MKKGIKSLIILLSVYACSNQENLEKKETNEPVGTELDSTNTELSNEDTVLVTPNFDYTVLEFPLTIDSLFIESHKIGMDTSNLSGEQVKEMSQNMLNKKGEPEISYMLSDFIKIDSLKQVGGYENYVQTLDIAMTKNINANMVGQLPLSQNNTVLIWSSTYTSYEACPFFYGTNVYATYYNGNNPIHTLLVGEVSGGGDAPYWADTQLESTIKPDQISLSWNQQNGGEYDENDKEIIEYNSEQYQFNITENGFVPVGQSN
ncbi:MAG: hypothetical protein ACWA41_03540 [Putridiphycobacter sp.]